MPKGNGSKYPFPMWWKVME